jgi:hypothetical protein
MRVVVVAFDCGCLVRVLIAEQSWAQSFRESGRVAVENHGTRQTDVVCWMWVFLVKVRGNSCWRAVIHVGSGGKRCGNHVSSPNYCSAAARHSHVVVVVSCEVAAHVKCDQALAALHLGKAHSRYLTTFSRSVWETFMFAGIRSHQCAPTSSKSSALAKPFRPAHGPPFKWLYSSSSTAKFQSAISASTLDRSCLLRHFPVDKQDDPLLLLQRCTKTKTRECLAMEE